jgi:hypothetical protein
MRRKQIALFAAALTSMSNVAWAGGIDPAKPALCANTDTFECVPGQNCIADTPEGINLPRFFRIDFAANRAYGERANGEKTTAEITNQKVEEGRIVLQGVQNGNGWSVMIDQATGNMSLAVSANQVGFVIFGACTQM